MVTKCGCIEVTTNPLLSRYFSSGNNNNNNNDNNNNNNRPLFGGGGGGSGPWNPRQGSQQHKQQPHQPPQQYKQQQKQASSFQPRRRPPKEYRPFRSKPKTPYRNPLESVNPFLVIDLNAKVENPRNEDEAKYGRYIADYMAEQRRQQAILQNDTHNLHDNVEEQLRAMDYMTTEPGTTEERIFERRAMEHMTEKEQQQFFDEAQEWVDYAEEKWLKWEDNSDFRKIKPAKPKKNEAVRELIRQQELNDPFADDDDPDSRFDPNQHAHGVWSEYLVGVYRGNHNWRGGRLLSYRAMVVGGNGNGCAGFGVGKGRTAMKAVQMAGRESRRNIFFADRFQGERFATDLVGKHNSCKVVIRTVSEGLRGNRLCRAVLARFGIVHGTSKAYGRRHPWNVVYATFKAVLGHESIEQIALKTGKRLVSVDKANRIKI